MTTPVVPRTESPPTMPSRPFNVFAASAAQVPVVQPRRGGSPGFPAMHGILGRVPPRDYPGGTPECRLRPMTNTAIPAGLDLPELAAGTVWLVGAGPGDPGLLSLLALHALGQADVVVYDALVDERVLRLARPGAILEYAGKRGGKASPKQPDISDRLVRLARAGMRVLRLKGGDPFVFGRGGEEALALVGAGI